MASCGRKNLNITTLSLIYSLNADNFWLVYNKPWIRIKAYLVGILGGWIYWKYGQILQDRVNKMPEVRFIFI